MAKLEPIEKNSENWFQSANLGLIFHWGVYSVPAFDDLSNIRRRRIQNGSEWYLQRLSKRSRVSNADIATKEYHKQNYPDETYKDLAVRFTAERLNMESWMQLAVSIGTTYVILTSKHHDGFCMWETKTAPNWNSFDVGPKMDIVKVFVELARKYNLRVGLYYSWMEFGTNCTKGYVDNIVHPQLRELIEYKIDLIWLDGDWVADSSKWRAKDIVTELKQSNPSLIINDRLGKNHSSSIKPNYRNYDDRCMSEKVSKERWESIHTIAYSWGRNKQQRKEHYKTGKVLHDLLVKVNSKNGNLLLNLGPDADGTLDEEEVRALKDLRDLLEKQKSEI
ncbi:unnamed protein product [Didymodactylos carnosus]|uniref:alpha-L-fucosidase n=1 Tax=Didymodactylos carnosus TaxID=1234261 RepID=A0A8S2DTB0_9BILA|nr:unnamed protein product [Didymodactylos carnosus]CAF3766514.1 unnamed protein product [Didymodactylos carnosus]